MDPRVKYLLRLADSSLILGQRLGEWVGHGPALEEDLGLANISLDLIGQARLLYAYAGEMEGQGRSEDDLAFLRAPDEFANVSLVEQPNGDFGATVVRQFLFDAWQLELYQALAGSADERLAEIAAKAVKEVRYHERFSSGWLIRLGDGTAESQRRVSEPLQDMWKFTTELFSADELDEQMCAAGVGPDLTELHSAWSARVEQVLEEATLSRPADVEYGWFGKSGAHTEHLGYILADMQYLQRTYPGASW
ncbi:MAG: phenylacetate-CoA oxygenase subunit PaaC [Gammaproteobacteria bacterium]|nr:phenylacetate-CoA oxygenase subunit PaaC [Gammaproteobacteria bacterium]